MKTRGDVGKSVFLRIHGPSLHLEWTQTKVTNKAASVGDFYFQWIHRINKCRLKSRGSCLRGTANTTCLASACPHWRPCALRCRLSVGRRWSEADSVRLRENARWLLRLTRPEFGIWERKFAFLYSCHGNAAILKHKSVWFHISHCLCFRVCCQGLTSPCIQSTAPGVD